MNCDHCPCPLTCLGPTTHPVFCEWAATGDPVMRAHVTNRSALGPDPEPPLPGVLALAGNLAAAVAHHLAGGLGLAPPEVAAARVAVCEACEAFRPSDRRCADAACGCFVSVKSTWLDQHCPRGKWPGDPAGIDRKLDA